MYCIKVYTTLTVSIFQGTYGSPNPSLFMALLIEGGGSPNPSLFMALLMEGTVDSPSII
jgi:hypothetical protein